MVPKWTGSGPGVTGSGQEVPVHPSVRLSISRPEVDCKCLYGNGPEDFWSRSVHPSVLPKHFPYLFDEPYARDLQV